MNFYLLLAAGLVVVATGPVLAAEPVPAALDDYVAKPDPSFRWERAGKTETPIGTAHDLRMTSQTWHDERWDHAVQVFVPTGTKPGATMLLYNTGGNPGPTTMFLGLLIARKASAPIAFLYNVPKQPLFGGKTEDKLIAETFVRYLDSGDPTWPLLFPMVKSVVRGMDAVQAFAADEFGVTVSEFVITGASKRGWTSWLTAATGDPRVKAIAPLVIDTLNMPAQMKNQVIAFGKPSEMIRDYVERDLVPIPPGEAAQAAVEDDRPVVVPVEARPAQVDRQRRERPVLAARSAEQLLGRLAGREVRAVRAERRAQFGRTPGHRVQGPGPGGRHPGRVRPLAVRRPADAEADVEALRLGRRGETGRSSPTCR